MPFAHCQQSSYELYGVAAIIQSLSLAEQEFVAYAGRFFSLLEKLFELPSLIGVDSALSIYRDGSYPKHIRRKTLSHSQPIHTHRVCSEDINVMG